MKNSIILSYDDYLAENAQSATVFNTPGMGNVSAGGTRNTFVIDTAEQDNRPKHLRMHERSHRGSDWMRPSGNYQNRNWLVPNYETFMDERQSITRFQIGEGVRCIDPSQECYGMMGKIVAFEDNTIRWEALFSKTGIGQTAKQYRCHSMHLEKAQFPG